VAYLVAKNLDIGTNRRKSTPAPWVRRKLEICILQLRHLLASTWEMGLEKAEGG